MRLRTAKPGLKRPGRGLEPFSHRSHLFALLENRLFTLPVDPAVSFCLDVGRMRLSAERWLYHQIFIYPVFPQGYPGLRK
jgi:hypothetical protein